ncbi:hypothetical protein PG989_010634 [Apiospora arundinis]
MENPMKVVIVGGSLTGLMCGIALKQAGHHVKILEREDDERESHMAGVCLGVDAGDFLALHDRQTGVFSHRCLRIQALKRDESVQVFVNARRDITNWDTFYYRLRSNLDGYTSTHYPAPSQTAETDGSVAYERYSQVLDVGPNPSSPGQMRLTVQRQGAEHRLQIDADLVIGADGPDSFIRSRYQPHVRREYAGYVAWRGTVPESEVSESTRHLFRRSVTVFMMEGHHHCLVYTIPGKDGSLEPGEKYLNFLWYTSHSEQELQDIMVDAVDGHRHHNIVPRGRVRQDIWERQLQRAREIPFAGPFLEVITQIRQPFVQVVTDFCSTQAAFEGGKVLLVGDGLSLFRPHTAFSGTQAAFHALRTAELVKGKISVQKWEETVLRYSRIHWLQSIWYGEFYQGTMTKAFMSAIRFWAYCGVDRIKSWWRGEESLLRGTSSRVEAYEDEVV